MAASFRELEDARQQGLGQLRTVAGAQANRLEAELRRQRRKLAEEEQAALDAKNDDWAWLKGGLSGLGSGAAAGTTIAPGWGTLIGGLAGFGLGAAGGALANETQDPALLQYGVPSALGAAGTIAQGVGQSFRSTSPEDLGLVDPTDVLSTELDAPTELRFKPRKTVQVGEQRLALQEPFSEEALENDSDVERYRKELDRVRLGRGY